MIILRWLLGRSKVLKINVRLLLRHYEGMISCWEHLDFIGVSLDVKLIFCNNFKYSLRSSLASRQVLTWLVKLDLLEVCDLKTSLKTTCDAVALAS